jgi:hypothetical protein
MPPPRHVARARAAWPQLPRGRGGRRRHRGRVLRVPRLVLLRRGPHQGGRQRRRAGDALDGPRRQQPTNTNVKRCDEGGGGRG